MRSSENNRRLVSSLIDRLLDEPPSSTVLPSSGMESAEEQDIHELILDVRRDLENLLNTRRRCTACPPELQELNQSLIDYGIPDFTGLNMSVPAEREATRLEIERAIRRFEPRLTNVVVIVQSSTERYDRRLRLRITAVLRTEPVAERVVFDSALEPSTAAVEIKAVS
jgi:type VI secretion system protein ImpF